MLLIARHSIGLASLSSSRSLFYFILKIEYFRSYVGLVLGTIYELVDMVAGILMIFFFVLQTSTFHHSIMCKFVDLWKTFVST